MVEAAPRPAVSDINHSSSGSTRCGPIPPPPMVLSRDLPWRLQMHCTSPPESITGLQSKGQTPQASFTNSLKEAAYILRGPEGAAAVMRAAGHLQDTLWQAVERADAAAYAAAATTLKLVTTRRLGQSPSIPLRLFVSSYGILVSGDASNSSADATATHAIGRVSVSGNGFSGAGPGNTEISNHHPISHYGASSSSASASVSSSAPSAPEDGVFMTSRPVFISTAVESTNSNNSESRISGSKSSESQKESSTNEVPVTLGEVLNGLLTNAGVPPIWISSKKSDLESDFEPFESESEEFEEVAEAVVEGKEEEEEKKGEEKEEEEKNKEEEERKVDEEEEGRINAHLKNEKETLDGTAGDESRRPSSSQKDAQQKDDLNPNASLVDASEEERKGSDAVELRWSHGKGAPTVAEEQGARKGKHRKAKTSRNGNLLPNPAFFNHFIVLVGGVSPSLEAPIGWLHSCLSSADKFLYVVVRPKG